MVSRSAHEPNKPMCTTLIQAHTAKRRGLPNRNTYHLPGETGALRKLLFFHRDAVFAVANCLFWVCYSLL